jgi:hypothetical protein
MGIGRFKELNLIVSKSYRGIFIQKMNNMKERQYSCTKACNYSTSSPNPQNMIQQSSNHDFELSDSGNINYNETWQGVQLNQETLKLLT